MIIEKYKYLKPNKYEIYFDNEKIILYEDVIIENKILLKSTITKDELEIFLKENTFYEYYYKALNFIKFRIRSEYEIEKLLNKNNISKDEINKIINKLKQEGYINDDLFTKCYINDCINLKNCGPLKIISELKKLGIAERIIFSNITIFTKEQQLEKIEKLINKLVKLNKNNSTYVLKQKILTNLINQGYEKEDIIPLLDNIKVDEDSIYKKEYNKLKLKLSRKYSGSELDLKIKQKLYQKGLYK